MDVDSGTDDRSKHGWIINLDIPLWSQKCPVHYTWLFENLEASSGTGKVESHAIRGQSSRQNDLTIVENEIGRRRRDVDNKEVSTAGVTLSRSRSNGTPTSCLIASG